MDPDVQEQLKGINTVASSGLPKLPTSPSFQPNPEGAGKKINI